MVAAGETAQAGKTPGERIATNILTADSATFTTTETTVQSVTAALVINRVYRVVAYSKGNSSVTSDFEIWRLREDNSTGTQLQSHRVNVDGSGVEGVAVIMEAEFTAVATGNKTFVLTGIRSSGTGNCFLEAAANHPSYLYVEYVRGP